MAKLLAQTPVPVLTWRYDLTHAGANTSETALTPANVNPTTFGKLFSVAVDGTTYAQPLYVPGLTMGDGQLHNVLFVATGKDSIYAFDADSNGGTNAKPLWQVTLLDAAHGAGANATAIPWQDTQSPDVAPFIGITGTPTINPATNTLYVVGATKENGVYFSRLHAINILTGAEQANSPVVVTATVAGTGAGSSGGKITFDPLSENQRTALNFYNGSVYFAFAAHGDIGSWHGWLFAYNGTTLAQTAVFCFAPNGTGDGIWMAGAGMPIDDGAPGGRMFAALANGPVTKYPPFNANTGLGESIVDFSLANGGITATDAFTTFNYDTINTADLDLGSGGILMLPTQQGAVPRVLVQVGKEGRILVLNRDNLGGLVANGATSNTNAMQDIPDGVKGLWSTPAYWHGGVYMWGSKDVPKRFDFDSGVINATPSSQSPVSSLYPGASFSISSDGDNQGIAWAARTDQFDSHGPAVLYAWDALNLGTLLYESDTNAKRDTAGAANRFAIPLVTNGKVYLAGYGQVDVYGLLNGESVAAAPVITPNGGSFGASQSVTLSTTTASASIYYTLDGSAPTTASTLYAGPITVSTGTTVRAIASAPGYLQSAVSSAVFTFTTQTPMVTFSPAAGAYTGTQQVTLADTDTNAKIYYTTDGSAPTAASTAYTGPVTVATSATINAIAIDPSLLNSVVASAAYTIQPTGCNINFTSGFASTAGLTLNGSTVNADDTRLQLTNGGLNQAGSVFCNQPISIQAFTTDFEFQLSTPQGDGFTFTIQNIGPTALGGNSGGLGYAGIQKSVAIKFDFYNDAGEGNDSTGMYTNGALPTVPAVDLTPSGIQLTSGDAMQAHVTYDGTTLTMLLSDLIAHKTFTLTQAINIPQIVGGNTAYVGFTGGTGGLTSSQKILTWTYSTQAPAATPTFSPVAGSYNAAQSVTISSATPGAAIYYTTDGTAPMTSSPAYAGAIAVGAGTTTIQAIAVASGFTPSAAATATYVVTIPVSPVTATPSFTPAAGTYTSAQSVTLADSTPNAVIYYTTDGTIPTKSSAVYSAAIQVSATATLQALAIASNAQPSAVATAAYTINLPVTPPAFALSATSPAAITAGASATSTITITPSGGFTGSVALTCALTASPAGVANPPTCSATAPVAISGTSAVTSTLTLHTTAPSNTAHIDPLRRIFTFGGGSTLAAFFLVGLPARRRRWQILFSLLLLVAFAGAGIGCGSSMKTQATLGTTAGSYTVTVTGTSGSTTAKTTVTVMVN